MYLNGIGVRQILVDTGLVLNIFGLDLLNLRLRWIKINLDTIILPLKVRPIIVPTLVYVMLGPLSSNLLLRPWPHAIWVFSSTLHGFVMFVVDNQVEITNSNATTYTCAK